MTHLTSTETSSEVWRKVVNILTERLDHLRKQNDGDLAPDATWKLRGQIAEIKRLLRMDESRPPMT